MSLKIGIQMDPMQGLHIEGDSTFALALEAQSRGHALFHYLPDHLSLNEGLVEVRASAMTVRDKVGDHVTMAPVEQMPLADMDVVLMRQDPPFDMAYISVTHILEHAMDDVLVVNNPTAVRNAPEKLLVTHFSDLMPPTLISRDPAAIHAFRDRHGDIIVKPLHGNGGAGVFRITEADENLNSLLEMFDGLYREPFVVQRYLPQVRAGDKRIILINGQPAGAVNRVPAEGEARSNLHVGGKAVAAELTEREEYICGAIGPFLKENGLVFVGIDVIGDYLTEINVTSPTGLREIKSLGGPDLSIDILDAIEDTVAAG
ncbi:MAG: glutathione synthase [Pseudomonadota bacterium]